MKFKLLTLGTRGDVQPFISLGQALQKAGHSVTICTADSFKAGVLQALSLPRFGRISSP